MRIFYILIFIISISIACNSKEIKKTVIEHNYFVELRFYPTGVIEDTRYLILIKDEKLKASNFSPWKLDGNSTIEVDLTESQKQKLHLLISSIKQNSVNKDNVEDAWGAQLKINSKIIFEDDDFSFEAPRVDIANLINYLVKVSSMNIDLYGFS